MRQWGRLSLELLFVALLYTAVGIVLGVFSAGWGSSLDVTRLLLQNLLAIVPLVFFIWKVEGTWWSVGGTCVLALATLQIVVPRMEMMLERGQTLVQLPTLALNAVGAAAAAVAALMMMLRSWKNGDSLPPYFWPAGAPVSYLWRIPALVASYGAAQVMAAAVGRILVGQVSRPLTLSELIGKAALGTLTVLVAFASAAHLGVRSPRRVPVLVGVLGVVVAVGRLQQLVGWPLSYMSSRVGFRLVADVVVALWAATVLLAPLGMAQGRAAPAGEHGDRLGREPDNG